jgi:hypothetical protein
MVTAYSREQYSNCELLTKFLSYSAVTLLNQKGISAKYVQNAG